MYATDLAYIHDAGFATLARDAAPELIRLLRRHRIGPAIQRRPVRAIARRRAGGPRARIVEAGCGSGILAGALVEAGYSVVGFDVSPAMIRLARARVAGAVFRAGSIATVRLPPCDAVIATGEVFNYVAWRSVRRFLVEAREALPSGGLFIFDFLESAARRTYRMRRFGGDDWTLLVSADLDSSGRVLTRRITTFRKIGRKCRRTREVHRVHLYSRGEVVSALAQAGFAVDLRRSYGRLRLMPGDVAVIARRR